MISVVMPVHNAVRYCAEAIQSILDQSFEDFELVVVDDGSTDGTTAIVDGFAEQDPRVRVIRQCRRGISHALNAGIEAARYGWIARMDADDVSYSHRLEIQLRAAVSNPDVAVWGGWAHAVNRNGEIVSLAAAGPLTRQDFARARADRQLIKVLHPTSFFRRGTLLTAGGYDPDFDGAEDLELWDRMAELGPVLTIPEPLLAYRVHPESLSTRRFEKTRLVARYVSDRRRRLEAGERSLSFDDYCDQLREAGWLTRLRRSLEDRGRLRYRRAGLAYADGRITEAFRHFAAATVLKPGFSITRAWRQVVSFRLRDGRTC